jgi:hypothetical protein
VDIICISYIKYIKFILYHYYNTIEERDMDYDIFESFSPDEPYPFPNYVKTSRETVIKLLKNIPDKYFLFNSNEYDEIILWMNEINIIHKSFLIRQLNNYL